MIFKKNPMVETAPAVADRAQVPLWREEVSFRQDEERYVGRRQFGRRGLRHRSFLPRQTGELFNQVGVTALGFPPDPLEFAEDYLDAVDG